MGKRAFLERFRRIRLCYLLGLLKHMIAGRAKRNKYTLCGIAFKTHEGPLSFSKIDSLRTEELKSSAYFYSLMKAKVLDKSAYIKFLEFLFSVKKYLIEHFIKHIQYTIYI